MPMGIIAIFTVLFTFLTSWLSPDDCQQRCPAEYGPPQLHSIATHKSQKKDLFIQKPSFAFFNHEKRSKSITAAFLGAAPWLWLSQYYKSYWCYEDEEKDRRCNGGQKKQERLHTQGDRVQLRHKHFFYMSLLITYSSSTDLYNPFTS